MNIENLKDLKLLIITRKKKQLERDALGGDFDLSNMDMGSIMGLMGKMPQLQQVIALSKEIEALSDQIIEGTVGLINTASGAV